MVLCLLVAGGERAVDGEGGVSAILDVIEGRARYAVECCRAENFAERLPAGCVNLATPDPPYCDEKPDLAWDTAWEDDHAFLRWMGDLCAQWKRVLAPNGSLYVFASARMGSRVEGVVRDHFEVLNNIRWRKPPHSTKAEMFDKDTMRRFFPASETIVFAEQYGADGAAMGAAGYDAKCGEAHKVVFGRAFGDYLRAEIERAGVTNREIAALFPSRSGGLTGCVSNWLLGYNCPTPEQYHAIRDFLNARGGDFLRREYEDLRREYEDLRRPFNVSAAVPYTDVWTYETVAQYPGKHPCEKPEDMARDIIAASSRPGDLVADFFCGSGVFLATAVAMGRRAIGCDMDPHWADFARRRCEMAAATGKVAVRRIVKPMRAQVELFSGAPAGNTTTGESHDPR